MKIKGIIYIVFVIIASGLGIPCLANPYEYPPRYPEQNPVNNPGHPSSSYYPNYQFPPLMQEYGSNPYHDSAREKQYPSSPPKKPKTKRKPEFPYPYTR